MKLTPELKEIAKRNAFQASEGVLRWDITGRERMNYLSEKAKEFNISEKLLKEIEIGYEKLAKWEEKLRELGPGYSTYYDYSLHERRLFNEFWTALCTVLIHMNSELYQRNISEKEEIIIPLVDEISANLQMKMYAILIGRDQSEVSYNVEKIKDKYNQALDLLEKGKELKLDIDSILLLNDLTFTNEIVDDDIINAAQNGLKPKSFVYLKSPDKTTEKVKGARESVYSNAFYSLIVENGQYFMVSYDVDGQICEKNPIHYNLNNHGQPEIYGTDENKSDYISLTDFLECCDKYDINILKDVDTGERITRVKGPLMSLISQCKSVSQGTLKKFAAFQICIKNGIICILDYENISIDWFYPYDNEYSRNRKNAYIEFKVYEENDVMQNEIEKQFHAALEKSRVKK